MIWTGASALAESGQSFDIFGAFENTNVGTSLVYGGLVGLAMAFVTVLRQNYRRLKSQNLMDWCEIDVWCNFDPDFCVDHRFCHR